MSNGGIKLIYIILFFVIRCRCIYSAGLLYDLSVRSIKLCMNSQSLTITRTNGSSTRYCIRTSNGSQYELDIKK